MYITYIYVYVCCFGVYTRSLPSWRSLQSSRGQELASEDVCSEEEIKALNSKEAQILISNLTSSDGLIQQEIITDVTQMRTIANVHESLVSSSVYCSGLMDAR